MRTSAGCAILLSLLALPAISETRSEQRTRTEFRFLCAYTPENGVTRFTSSRCGDEAAISTASPRELRGEMDAHWGNQPDMRYQELTILNYQAAFSRAHPPENDPRPTPEQLKTLQTDEVCDWWRTRRLPDAMAELERRQAFSKKDTEVVRSMRIAIGMSESAMICSWGEFKDRNRTATANGMHIQYVYERALVYVDNGVVTSWQD